MNNITIPTLRRLMENDHSLEEVRVSPNYAGDPGTDYSMRPYIADIFPRSDTEWKIAGKIIGNNTCLSTLMLCGAGGIEYGDGCINKIWKYFSMGTKGLTASTA